MDILFWSGGKDSYLALQFYRKSHSGESLKLLTTYDESRDIVPHQRIELEDIEGQAKALGLDLLTVPLPPDCPNDIYLERLEDTFDQLEQPVEHLVFGDWKLEDIREWREKVFGDMGYHCLFPIWQKSLDELLPELLFKPVEIKISAVREEFASLIRVGESYDQSFVAQLRHLPEDIDPMGENGEFHTRIEFVKPDGPGRQPLVPGG